MWATLGGLGIGGLLGAATGRLVVYLRSRHDEAVGLDEFLGLGLVAMAYGIAQLALASGFLAVFAAGLALQRVRERPRSHTRPLAAAAEFGRAFLRNAGDALPPRERHHAGFRPGLQ